MSSEIEVIFNRDYIAYPNGFTRCEFKSGEKYSIPKEWGEIQISAGNCEPFLERETKPAPITKETKEIKKTGPVKKATTKKIKGK
jgi:hypothetical protein